MERVTKYTKEEVGYKLSSSPAEHRCELCSFHLHVPGTDKLECGIVEGPIDKMYGCKLFDVNLIKAANDKINLLNHPPK
jgi:hypothetical protein